MDNEDMPGCYTGDNPWGTLRDDPTPEPSAPAEPSKGRDLVEVYFETMKEVAQEMINEAPVAPASSAAREWLEKELADPKSMIACKWLSRVAEEDGVLDYLVMLLSRFASAERQQQNHYLANIYSILTGKKLDDERPALGMATSAADRLVKELAAERQRVAELERERDEYKEIRDTIVGLVAIGTGAHPDKLAESPVKFIRELKARADAAEAKLREATELITEVANQTCGCYAIDDPNWHSDRCVTGKAQAWLRNQSTE